MQKVQNVLNKLRDSQDKINNALSEQKEDILNHVHDVNENLGNALWKANASLAEQMTNQNDSLISNDDGIKALILEGQTKASENNTAQLNRIDSLSESVSGFENGMQAVMKAHDETQRVSSTRHVKASIRLSNKCKSIWRDKPTNSMRICKAWLMHLVRQLIRTMKVLCLTWD